MSKADELLAELERDELQTITRMKKTEIIAELEARNVDFDADESRGALMGVLSDAREADADEADAGDAETDAENDPVDDEDADALAEAEETLAKPEPNPVAGTSAEAQRLRAELEAERAKRVKAEERLARLRETPRARAAEAEAEEIENAWPLEIDLPNGETYTIERDNCLVNINNRSKAIQMDGEDGRNYRIPRGALVPKELFPNFRRMQRSYLIPFKGNPKKGHPETKGARCVIVPGFSARR